MTQPEALRLAAALDAYWGAENGHDRERQAAAELRRLHEAHDWQYRMAGERLRRIEKLEAQRDALLEALELAADFLEHSTEFRIGHPGFEGAQAKARAAIKAVEGEKG
jgi:hypothetical protein